MGSPCRHRGKMEGEPGRHTDPKHTVQPVPQLSSAWLRSERQGTPEHHSSFSMSCMFYIFLCSHVVHVCMFYMFSYFHVCMFSCSVSSFHCLRGLSVSVVLTSENSNAALSTNSFSDQTLVLGPISLPTNQSTELSLPAEADAVTSEEVRQSVPAFQSSSHNGYQVGRHRHLRSEVKQRTVTPEAW